MRHHEKNSTCFIWKTSYINNVVTLSDSHKIAFLEDFGKIWWGEKTSYFVYSTDQFCRDMWTFPWCHIPSDMQEIEQLSILPHKNKTLLTWATDWRRETEKIHFTPYGPVLMWFDSQLIVIFDQDFTWERAFRVIFSVVNSLDSDSKVQNTRCIFGVYQKAVID
jgi:hypothetical protein